MPESTGVILENRGHFWRHGEKTPRGRFWWLHLHHQTEAKASLGVFSTMPRNGGDNFPG